MIKRGTMETQGCKFIISLDFLGFLRITMYCIKISKRRHVMERLDVEVQYRAAKWLFPNMFFEGEITLEEYTAMHKLLVDKLNPPLKSVETPGFYIQEAFDE